MLLRFGMIAYMLRARVLFAARHGANTRDWTVCKEDPTKNAAGAHARNKASVY